MTILKFNFYQIYNKSLDHYDTENIPTFSLPDQLRPIRGGHRRAPAPPLVSVAVGHLEPFLLFLLPHLS